MPTSGLLAACRMALLLAWLALPASAGGQEAGDIPREAISLAGLQPVDLALLDHPQFRWRHLQTDHFILHYERRMFAERVARLGEQFYAAISADLPDLRDRVAPNPSHIFIFRQARDWQAVVNGQPGLEPWAASFVRGQVMYLQEIGQATSDKMGMLAHEMTHLVFNRFIPVRLPLWLNEGLAEYYGEFAYRAARGMGQSRRSAFPPLRQRIPLEDLLNAQTYPPSAADIRSFYATSKYLVGFLLLRFPRETWDRFLGRIVAGENALAALLDTYGWADIQALEREFSRFAR